MRVIVFSGTTEGREISKYAFEKGMEVTVCVATDYGKEVMKGFEGIEIKTGRMSLCEITKAIMPFDFVIDATHPYARIITENIKKACKSENKRYIRLLRDEEKTEFKNIIWFDDIKQIADYVSKTDGDIFLTTGSNQCGEFYEKDRKRITLRVLDTVQSRQKTQNMGFKRVIYENPPFDTEKNIKHFSESGASFVVTKSSGKSGGFGDKIDACNKLGLTVLAVKRPKEEGLGIDEVKRLIDNRYKRFPLFVDISTEKVLVVGGGNIALRRIKTLMKYCCDITVIAKEIKDNDIRKNVSVIQKEFEQSDIKDDYFMVISAANDRNVNKTVGEICRKKGINVSVADCSDECTFFFPSTITTDELSIGIVSDGEHHKAVKEMRKRIERTVFCDEQGER